MTRPNKRPSTFKSEKSTNSMIRVDHAGEYGAVRIYEGQMAVLGTKPAGKVISHMLEQEKHHLKTFDKLIAKRQVRPTVLLPLWHLAGFTLGATTALLGEKAAMACTVAVEEVIDEHYSDQIEALGERQGKDGVPDETELRQTCETFRAEELEHRATGLKHGAEEAPGYEALTTVVKTGSRLAIWLSERI